MSGANGVTLHVASEIAIVRSPRVMQMEGLFDVPRTEKSATTWDVVMPLGDRRWHIGLIVGPSGSGKSTIARAAFPENYTTGFTDWSPDAAVIDAFPDAMSIKDIALLMSSVGFSSPPAWLRPYRALSNGEQFRVTLARALAVHQELCVFDEFTSVVDRTVGKIGSHAVAKTVRQRGQQFVAVTCHDDVLEWLDPDWVFTPADNRFAWRELQRRPAIEIEIARVRHPAWALFHHHHYLSADLNKAAVCFCGFIDRKPVAFHAYLPFVGHLRSRKKAVRGHRYVTLPDYQGCGIGKAMHTVLASMWAGLDHRVFRASSHPAEIASAQHDPNWQLTRTASLTSGREGSGSMQGRMRRASNRLTTSFEYVGPAMPYKQAFRLLET